MRQISLLRANLYLSGLACGLLLSARLEAMTCEASGGADSPFFTLEMSEEHSRASVKGIFITASNGFSKAPAFRMGDELKRFGTGEGRILVDGPAEIRSQMNADQKCEVRINFPGDSGFLILKSKDGSQTSMRLKVKSDLEIGSDGSFYPVAELFNTEVSDLKCRPSAELFNRICNKGEVIPAGESSAASGVGKAKARKVIK